jgi:hypothetical protein
MSEKSQRPVPGMLRSLASLKLTVAALLLLATLVAGGTVYQAGSGLHAAQRDVFSAWLIWILGVIPLPGMLPVALLLFVNLLAAALFRLRYCWRCAGLLLIHYGLLLLIGGGFFIAATAQEYFLTLSEGESSRLAFSADGMERAALPITIRLHSFEKVMHPGTEIPKSFSSRVEILAGGIRRQAVIAMNRPLCWRDLAFYQSSYAEDEQGGKSSTFSVVRSSGRRLPYIASALIFLGLAVHFLGMSVTALKKPRAQPERIRP